MPSPMILLILALAWGASLVGADHFGVKRTEDRLNAETGKQIDALVKQHNADSLADMQAAAEMATREAAAKTRTVYIRGAANEAIAKAPAAANCNLSTDRYNVLLAGIAEANGGDSKDAAAGVSDAIRKASQPPGK